MAVSRSSDKCFNCKQLGHWAKDCPNNSTQEQLPKFSLGNDVIPPKCAATVSRSSDKCFNCKQLGHWAKDCPNYSTQEQLPKFSLGNDVIPPNLCHHCRRQCAILTSNSSANPGRKYYKCYQCNKFLDWCDDLATSASQNPNPKSQSRYLNPNDHSQNFNPVLSTPSYNNPNSSPTPSNNTSLGFPSYNLSHNPSPPAQIPTTSGHEESGLEQQFEASSIRCACDAGPCLVVTDRTKENKVRRYFACHIKKGEGSCEFFKWCDELD